MNSNIMSFFADTVVKTSMLPNLPYYKYSFLQWFLERISKRLDDDYMNIIRISMKLNFCHVTTLILLLLEHSNVVRLNERNELYITS